MPEHAKSPGCQMPGEREHGTRRVPAEAIKGKTGVARRKSGSTGDTVRAGRRTEGETKRAGRGKAQHEPICRKSSLTGVIRPIEQRKRDEGAAEERPRRSSLTSTQAVAVTARRRSAPGVSLRLLLRKSAGHLRLAKRETFAAQVVDDQRDDGGIASGTMVGCAHRSGGRISPPSPRRIRSGAPPAPR
jgi:hypothetical protein